MYGKLLMNIWLRWWVSGVFKACYQKLGKVECFYDEYKGAEKGASKFFPMLSIVHPSIFFTLKTNSSNDWKITQRPIRPSSLSTHLSLLFLSWGYVVIHHYVLPSISFSHLGSYCRPAHILPHGWQLGFSVFELYQTFFSSLRVWMWLS